MEKFIINMFNMMFTVIANNCSVGAILGICHVVSGTREFHFHLWLVGAGDKNVLKIGYCDQNIIFNEGLASKENMGIDYSNQNASDMRHCPPKLSHCIQNIFYLIFLQFDLSN